MFFFFFHDKKDLCGFRVVYYCTVFGVLLHRHSINNFDLFVSSQASWTWWTWRGQRESISRGPARTQHASRKPRVSTSRCPPWAMWFLLCAPSRVTFHTATPSWRTCCRSHSVSCWGPAFQDAPASLPNSSESDGGEQVNPKVRKTRIVQMKGLLGSIS